MKKLMMLFLFILSAGFGNQLSAQSSCDEACIDWYLVITDDRGRVLSETFLYTTCNGDQTISACEQSGSQAKIILTEDQASCEEIWTLMVVMSHEDNAYCGSYVKAKGRILSKGRGNWGADAFLDKYIGAQIFTGVCETVFYSIYDYSFIASQEKPHVTANFIAEVGVGVKITIGPSKVVVGDGYLWFDVAKINMFKDTQFGNPLCW